MNLGVDFGTTRTVVAYADRGNYPVVSFFDTRGDAHDWYPSVVAERGGELFFGFEALALGESGSEGASAPRAARSTPVMRSFKRLLSDPHAVPGKAVRVGGVTLGLGELVERFLGGLREALEKRSNLGHEQSAPVKGKKKAAPAPPCFRSVVAVPANAHGAQRFVTLDAFRRAGFAPVAMLNEPSAAGFEYTHRHRGTLTSKRDHVVVYDLGGGTFDASLVRMRGNRHEVLATAGVNQLGGDDFDDVLVGLVCDATKIARADLPPATLERLVDECRDAKERLNPSSRRIAIDLEHVLGRAHPEAIVEVARFYEACAPLVERSIEAMVPVMARLERAGQEGEAEAQGAGDAASEIAGIYVVGGASELPIVARALRQRFGRRVHRSPYPSAAIAIGLAIACDDAAGFELADRYSRTFGVFREGAAGSEITLDPIFTSETALPELRASGPDRAPVRFRRDYRAAHNVGHFRFFECGAVDPDGRPRGDMTVSGDVLFPFDPRLGEVSDLRGVQVERIGEGPHIEEEYSLDENGIVAVTIRNVDLGYERAYRIGA
ncbi:MAG: Hsp70 family protein [Polyangiaceae bacterium]|jgi:molecular chaperone DnaK (HSP70)